MKKISNPVFEELANLKIINKKKITIISQQTRDKKIAVLKDKDSGVIFLEKCITKDKYYKTLKYQNNPKHYEKDSNVKTLNGSFKTSLIQDDARRAVQFNKFLKNKKILDFGCGWGGFLKNIKKPKTLTGVELRRECLYFIKKNIKKIYITDNLNSLKEKYDTITLFHVLEHVPYQIDTLKNLKSKLSKNGKIIIEVPSAQDFLLSFNEFKEFKKFTFWAEHLILHTEASLRKILKKSGFKKIRIEYYQRYNFANHLGWFIMKKPGGHNFYKKISDKKIEKNYEDYLKRIKKTDTLIAIASN
jgi:2-polyprenyl-3-methyl-5-hydroxy-6-metoxy-1,4-benzoquinol methylase